MFCGVHGHFIVDQFSWIFLCKRGVKISFGHLSGTRFFRLVSIEECGSWVRCEVLRRVSCPCGVKLTFCGQKRASIGIWWCHQRLKFCGVQNFKSRCGWCATKFCCCLCMCVCVCVCVCVQRLSSSSLMILVGVRVVHNFARDNNCTHHKNTTLQMLNLDHLSNCGTDVALDGCLRVRVVTLFCGWPFAAGDCDESCCEMRDCFCSIYLGAQTSFVTSLLCHKIVNLFLM